MATPTALIKDLEGEVSVTRNGEVVNLKAGDLMGTAFHRVQMRWVVPACQWMPLDCRVCKS